MFHHAITTRRDNETTTTYLDSDTSNIQHLPLHDAMRHGRVVMIRDAHPPISNNQTLRKHMARTYTNNTDIDGPLGAVLTRLLPDPTSPHAGCFDMMVEAVFDTLTHVLVHDGLVDADSVWLEISQANMGIPQQVTVTRTHPVPGNPDLWHRVPLARWMPDRPLQGRALLNHLTAQWIDVFNEVR